MPKKKRKIAVNVYEEYTTNVVKHWIFKRAIRKVDLLFVTNDVLYRDMPNGVLIPDYAYSDTLYGRYNNPQKKERVVCLGTMNEKKQLEKTVRVFARLNYPLYIVGQFLNIDFYNKLLERKTDNVCIENRYVGEEEYYELLNGSKFCIIPYDPNFYKNRTSGVIQESLFMKTIPIAPSSLLEFSNIEGLGYDALEDLEKIDLYSIKADGYIEKYQDEINRKYRYDAIQRKVIEGLNKIL